MQTTPQDLISPIGAAGHYALAIQTGAIAAGAAADAEVLQFRWASTSRLAVIHKIAVTGMRASTAFAAGSIDIKATIARAWTAAGTGGTALTLTSDQNGLRASYEDSVASVRIATTAALGAGTKTLGTYDIGQITTHSSGGTGSATPIIGSIFLPKVELFDSQAERGGSPLVLANEEGFVIRATVPGTGVWNLGVEVIWAEV